MVADAQRSGKTIRGTFREFQAIVSERIGTHLEFTRYINPALFNVIKNHPLDIAFFGFEQGIPILAHIQYEIADPGAPSLKIIPRPEITVGKCANGRSNMCGVIIGVKSKAMQYLNSHQIWADLVVTARSAIEASISEEPDGVGPPIRIWTITPSGIQANQNGCPIKGEPPPLPQPPKGP
jgi:hypothetical protein